MIIGQIITTSSASPFQAEANPRKSDTAAKPPSDRFTSSIHIKPFRSAKVTHSNNSDTNKNAFTMTSTLTHLTSSPPWVLHLFDGVDELDFTDHFDSFLPDAELQFGTAHVKGVPAMKEFLILVDGPVNMKHHILDFWDSGAIKILRGEATMAKKEEPETVIVAPFVNIFYMAESDNDKVARWIVVGGPINPEKLLG